VTDTIFGGGIDSAVSIMSGKFGLIIEFAIAITVIGTILALRKKS
jgi:hypothetical protein